MTETSVNALSLTIRDSLPEGFLDCSPRDLHRLLPQPTLIELPGRKDPPLFVSALLHGNEDAGLTGMQHLLRNWAGRTLPRSLMLLIGNVSAAREGLRRLDGQPDYNRVWPGTHEHRGTPEAAVMARVHERILQRQAFAAIDLHNNTGLNPHYGITCSLDVESLYLASLFSRTAVWFRGLPGAQTSSMAGRLPAMTAECGQPGVPANGVAAARLVEAAMELSEFPSHAIRHQDIDLYHTRAVVRLKAGLSISFDGSPADLMLAPQSDRMNFRELAAGHVFGETGHAMPVEVLDEAERDVTDAYFTVAEGSLRLRRTAIPAMLTLDARVIRQDCLCYLMEPVPADLLPPDILD